jgi:hypothetical protein
MNTEAGSQTGKLEARQICEFCRAMRCAVEVRLVVTSAWSSHCIRSCYGVPIGGNFTREDRTRVMPHPPPPAEVAREASAAHFLPLHSPSPSYISLIRPSKQASTWDSARLFFSRAQIDSTSVRWTF